MSIPQWFMQFVGTEFEDQIPELLLGNLLRWHTGKLTPHLPFTEYEWDDKGMCTCCDNGYKILISVDPDTVQVTRIRITINNDADSSMKIKTAQITHDLGLRSVEMQRYYAEMIIRGSLHLRNKNDRLYTDLLSALIA